MSPSPSNFMKLPLWQKSSVIMARRFFIKTLAQTIRENDHQFSRCSILDNGLHVATQPVYGHFSTIGVAISAGSRYETFYPRGIAHFIEKLAFSSTMNYPDKANVLELLDKCAALVDCQSTRDTFLYASSCRTTKAYEVLQIIADAVLRPNIFPDEVNFCRDIISYENETLARQPECEPLLTDWIHQAAFRQNTVGLPRYCGSDSSSDAVHQVTSKHILTYLSQYYTPPRIVLAGVGVDHDWLIDAGKELFDPSNTTWANAPNKLLDPIPQFDNSLAQYTGGEIRVERDLSQMALGPAPFPNLAHIVLGFQGVSVSHTDFVPFCVLHTLMGGGGSFSAGGPGKGMFTRLYTDVLNKHHWIYNATAYNHSYSDCGLFCIRASADPKTMSELPQIVLEQFRRLCKGVGREELQRAKTQLKSQLLMNLEMRPVQFEDLARQVLAHGKRKTTDDYSDEIDKVQNEDIIRIGHNMLNSRISCVGYGDLREMPSYEKLQKFL